MCEVAALGAQGGLFGLGGEGGGVADIKIGGRLQSSLSVRD